MVRARVYGILAGYDDQNDHDTLRSDTVFKLVAGVPGADDDLAYLVTRLRQAWPDVALHTRGDWAFGMPDIYDVRATGPTRAETE